MTMTAEEVRAALKRNHPDLTDADIDRILTGPPARRRRGRRPLVDNAGKREAAYETTSTGRTTTRHLPIADEEDDR